MAVQAQGRRSSREGNQQGPQEEGLETRVEKEAREADRGREVSRGSWKVEGSSRDIGGAATVEASTIIQYWSTFLR